MSPAEYREKCSFVSKLGIGLHECGATTHRIERHLRNLCELLGIHGSFWLTPTSFTFCYWLEDETDQHIQVRRLQPADGDLGRLELIDTLVDRFESGELSFEEMKGGLSDIMTMPPAYGFFAQWVAAVLLSASFAVLVSDNLNDVLSAGMISVFLFFFLKKISGLPRFVDTVEIFAALISGLLATGISALGYEINIPFVILSAIIVYVPGLGLTTALSEIAHRELVSGTSKFVHAVMNLLKLYFGSVFGVTLGSLLWGEGVGEVLHGIENLPSWKTLPAVIIFALTHTVAFHVRPRQLPWCLLAAVIGFFVARMGEEHFGVAAGMFLGALAVALYANLFSNIRHIPGSIVLSGGLVLLVPGSKTYLILNSWITGEQMVESSSNVNQAVMIFISLVMGLLFANVLLPTKKSL